MFFGLLRDLFPGINPPRKVRRAAACAMRVGAMACCACGQVDKGLEDAVIHSTNDKVRLFWFQCAHLLLMIWRSLSTQTTCLFSKLSSWKRCWRFGTAYSSWVLRGVASHQRGRWAYSGVGAGTL